MQMYVHYYERELINEGDNPLIGIVLCADKSESVVKYTLPENETQIFASKCKLYLPSEEELLRELNQEQVSLKALVHIANALEINIDSLLRGNQVGDKQEYQNELIELLKDCSAFEKRFIFEQARAIKKIIRENLPLVENKEKY